MDPRVDVSGLDPVGYGMVLGLDRHVRSRVDHRLYELVKIRASVINGCAFCIDMHTTDALRRGEDQRRLFALAAWRESPFFDEHERAALELTDVVTRLGEEGVPDEVWQGAVDAFGAEGAVDLLFAIATINVWNRIALTSRIQPPALVAHDEASVRV